MLGNLTTNNRDYLGQSVHDGLTNIVSTIYENGYMDNMETCYMPNKVSREVAQPSFLWSERQ